MLPRNPAASIAGIVVLQLAFTYLPIMQLLFDTRCVAIADGTVIVAVGVALLAIIELEKRIQMAWRE